VESNVATSGKSMFAIMLATYKSSRNIDFAHGKLMLQIIALEDLVTQSYVTRLFMTLVVMFPKFFFLTTFPLLAILYETMHMIDTIGTMNDAKQRCKNNPYIKFYKRSNILFWISICVPKNNS
jgi:hypothetical protein